MNSVVRPNSRSRLAGRLVRTSPSMRELEQRLWRDLRASWLSQRSTGEESSRRGLERLSEPFLPWFQLSRLRVTSEVSVTRSTSKVGRSIPRTSESRSRSSARSWVSPRLAPLRTCSGLLTRMRLEVSWSLTRCSIRSSLPSSTLQSPFLVSRLVVRFSPRTSWTPRVAGLRCQVERRTRTEGLVGLWRSPLPPGEAGVMSSCPSQLFRRSMRTSTELRMLPSGLALLVSCSSQLDLESSSPQVGSSGRLPPGRRPLRESLRV